MSVCVHACMCVYLLFVYDGVDNFCDVYSSLLFRSLKRWIHKIMHVHVFCICLSEAGTNIFVLCYSKGLIVSEMQ